MDRIQYIVQAVLSLSKIGLLLLFFPAFGLLAGYLISGTTAFLRRYAITLLWAFLFNCVFVFVFAMTWPRGTVPWPMAVLILTAGAHAIWLHSRALSMAHRR